MNKVQREKALDKIRDDKKIKCILISFKAGSIGELFLFLVWIRWFSHLLIQDSI